MATLRVTLDLHALHWMTHRGGTPPLLDERRGIKGAEELGELLGKHQDLDVLRSAYPEDTALEAKIQNRQAKLREKARPHGERLSADRPKDWLRRLRVWFAAAGR